MADTILSPNSQGSWQPIAPPAAGKPLWETLTYRRFAYAMLLAVALVATFMLMGLAESSVTGRAAAIHRPFAVATICVGIAHFIIGFCFMVSSRSMRTAGSRINIILALLIGGGLCWIYALAVRHNTYARLLPLLVFVYFVIHELRDEGFFYRQYKEAPVVVERRNDILVLLVASVLGLGSLYWSFVIPFEPQSRSVVWIIDARLLEGWLYYLVWLGPSAILALACAACIGWVKQRTGLSLAALYHRDRPLWMVYFTIPIFVLAMAPIGVKGRSIVLLHVSAWWVFVSFNMARSGKKSGIQKLGLGGWLRETQTGFQTLHIVLTLLVLAAMFSWVYQFDSSDQNILSWVAKPESFYYWTIVHITVSFVPKPP